MACLAQRGAGRRACPFADTAGEDNRSFKLNDEANLNVFDAGFAAEQTAMFEADLARSRQISLAEWRSRPWMEKLLEHTAALAAPQL